MKKQITKTLLLAMMMAWSVAGFSQSVSLKGSDVAVEKLFDAIKKQTGYTFFYPAHALKNAKPVTVDISGTSLKAALDLICKEQPFTYNINGKIITISLTTDKKSVTDSTNNNSKARSQLITGRITNKEGHVLAGATIRVKNKPIAETSNENGWYSIPAEADDQLIITYVNYMQQTVAVKARKVIDITMQPANNAMEEVTISTGYQKIGQKYLTGSVTSLKMSDIMQTGLSSVDQMLEGRVPGLIVLQNSGQVGATPRLRIRGTSTILGTREPLWVVDGIALTDPVPVDPSRLNDLDFVNLVGNAISGINPNDIDSITVLKDAAATVLYGVRAANGVIVVTTKKGKAGPPALNYSTSINFTRRPRYTDRQMFMMNSLERVDVSQEMFDRQIPSKGVSEAYEKAIIDYYNGSIDKATYLQRINSAKTMNTDWLGAVTQDVLTSNHALSLSGGNPQSTYYASVGYNNTRGVINGEYKKLYTGRLNFNLNYRKLKAGFSLSANKIDQRNPPSDLPILDYAYGTSRAIPVYREKDSLYFYAASTNGIASMRPSFNLLNEMAYSGQSLEGSGYTFSGNFIYQLLEGLQLTSDISFSTANTEQRTWYGEQTNRVDQIRSFTPDFPSSNGLPFGGELAQSNHRMQSYSVRGSILFNRFADMRKKHLLTAQLFGELSSAKTGSLEQTRRGYYPERGHSFAEINLNTYTTYANWLQTFGQPKITEALVNNIGAFASASYIYDDRYVLTLNARSEFSNAFGTRSNERFMPTWGISARWNMDKDILKDKPWVNMAALRLTYGTRGNMPPGQTPYAIIEKGNLNSNYEAFSSTIVNFPNPALQWEKVDDYGAGLDFSLFNQRLKGSLEVYYKKTTNALLTSTVSVVNGVSVYMVNAGDIENKGVDLIFQFTPVNGGKKGLVWRMDPQLGQVFNKLLGHALGTDRQAVVLDKSAINYNSFLEGSVPVNGKSINTFYAYRFKTLDEQGVPVFYGAEPENAAALEAKYNKMLLEDVLKEVMVEAGRREPVIQGGILNSVRYQNWELGFNLTYSLGNKIRLLKIASGNYGTFQPSSQQNLRKEFVNRWRYPGDEERTNIPGIFPAQNALRKWWDVDLFASDYYQMYDNSDLRTVSGNYLKLQYVSLSYRCSPEVCKRLGMKAAFINLSGSNLFTWASKELRGQDPTQSGTSPNINLGLRPTFSAAINIGF